jgi:3-methyladenine DNA glycosylase AlkD
MANKFFLEKEMRLLADKKQAEILSHFFKTGPGQYGEGDVFLGLKVPVQRKLARKYANLEIEEIDELLQSPIHEHRLTALFVLIGKFGKAASPEQKKIFQFYLKNARRVNNWDLVDLSAPNIVGKYLLDKKDKELKVLERLSVSHNMWERRIAILATFEFIRSGRSDLTFRLALKLLNDREDLIHKAVGWMLREVGKRIGEAEEEKFLLPCYRQMPRTMLRYAIERFPEEKRKKYLRGEANII